MFCISPVLTAKVAFSRPKRQLSCFNLPPIIFRLLLFCPPSSRQKNVFPYTNIFLLFPLHHIFHQILSLLFSGPNICPLQVLCSAHSLSRTIKDPFTDVSTVQPIWLCLLAIDFKMVLINKSLASGLTFVLTFSCFFGGKWRGSVRGVFYQGVLQEKS